MKTIEELAEDAGLDTSRLTMGAASYVTTHGRPFVDRADLVDFAAAVRREALEAAEKIAYAKANEWGFDGRPKYALEDCAAAIKALQSQPYP